MPEAHVPPTAETERKLAVLSNGGIGDSDIFPLFDNGSEDDVYVLHPEEEKWGFRITGGAEFKMPVVVFQVTEGSLAAKNGIKLGDVIRKINGIDSSTLNLSEARKIIDQAEESLELIVEKMEEENEAGVEEKTIVLKQPLILKDLAPPRAHIQKRLDILQRKLAEIAEIPKLLQSTLETVSKTVEHAMPSESLQHDLQDISESITENYAYAKTELSEYEYVENNYEFSEDGEEYEDCYYEDSLDSDDSSYDDEEVDEEPKLLPELEVVVEEPTPEPTEEDLLKREKREKILKVEKSWPWEDRKKVIHKFSNIRLAPSVSMVKERIQQFDKTVLSGRNFNKF
ncbi:uncharacterized protein LOC119651482 [Hermetia illucens]|uniref:uncharacterized protein LOC119651482 n=1 Tax=Hermetia illucens TaxID=343691 RepID=UPI0018CBF826|nr:uncharacterized protein LOC119651482 [Hermetia illucens]